MDFDTAFTHEAGALLMGSGTVDVTGATVTFNGDVTPGTAGGVGTLTIAGDLALGTGATVIFDAQGATTPGMDYDQLVVTGTVTLAGSGVVVPYGGYTPTAGDLLTVISSGGTPSGPWTVTGWTVQLAATAVELLRP
jgi:hypothetical protein